MFVGCQPFSHVAKDFCRPNGRRRSAQVPPVRARGGFDSPAPALPPCFAWRAKQARLTQVTADVRLLEQATVAQKRAWPFLPPGAGFWYAAAALISDVVARFDPTTDRLALLLKLQERRAEAQQLDAAILRERIASLPVPELEQIRSWAGPPCPEGLFAPRLAQFFASMPMDDVSVAEAYLASLELMTCTFYLRTMRAGETFAQAAPDAMVRRVSAALAVCDFALYWYGMRDEALAGACARQTASLQRWQSHLGLPPRLG